MDTVAAETRKESAAETQKAEKMDAAGTRKAGKTDAAAETRKAEKMNAAAETRTTTDKAAPEGEESGEEEAAITVAAAPKTSKTDRQVIGGKSLQLPPTLAVRQSQSHQLAVDARDANRPVRLMSMDDEESASESGE